jgi:predicted RNase H-like nuclease (RuvC/YqgF family)
MFPYVLLIDTGSIINIVVAVLGAGGIAGGVTALYKLRSEKDRIVVDASKGALIVQTGVIENLNKELLRVRAEAEQLRNELEKERELNRELRDRLEELENKVEQLTGRTASIEEHQTHD